MTDAMCVHTHFRVRTQFLLAGVYPGLEDPFESVLERGFERVVVVDVGYARYARDRCGGE